MLEPLFIAAGRAEVSSLPGANRPEESGGLWPGTFYDLTSLQGLIVFILAFVIRRLLYTMDCERYAVQCCYVNRHTTQEQRDFYFEYLQPRFMEVSAPTSQY